MKFTIDRSKWLRGEGSQDSYLLRADGRMCCMGQIALALGDSEERIFNRPSPLEAGDESRIWEFARDPTCSRVLEHREWIMSAMKLNDRGHEPAREERLRALFAQNGHELEFVDGEDS